MGQKGLYSSRKIVDSSLCEPEIKKKVKERNKEPYESKQQT